MKLILASEFDISFEKTKPYFDRAKGRNVTFIPTIPSGEVAAESYDEQIAPFINNGFICQTLHLEGKSQHDVEQAFVDTDIILVGCGNSFFHLEHMHKCEFKKILLKKLEEGVLYSGTSAGAIIASPDINFIAPMDDPLQANAIGTKGLGLIDFYFLPHADHPEMGKNANIIINQHKVDDKPLYVMNDDQAIYVENNIVKFL